MDKIPARQPFVRIIIIYLNDFADGCESEEKEEMCESASTPADSLQVNEGRGEGEKHADSMDEETEVAFESHSSLLLIRLKLNCAS